MNALKLARPFSQDLGKRGITLWPLDPLHILFSPLGWGEEEEEEDGTSGPSLLVTHYNPLPKVLLCPQNPVGETQASAEEFVAIHPWEPFGGHGKEGQKRQGPCFCISAPKGSVASHDMVG